MKDKSVKDYLNQLDIKFQTHKHPAVYTVGEAEKYYVNIKGIHSKNLFLKDRKARRFYLVVLKGDKQLNISNLEERLNEKLKFANEQELLQILDLTKGAVTPFGLINDKQAKVEVIIDKDIWEAETVAFHPNINTETLELKGKDFQKYIKSLKNKITILDL